MSQNASSLIVLGQSSRRPYKYDIPNSVRFRGQTGSNDGQYFTRSITSSSDVDTGTISFWIRHARYTAGDDISHQETCLWGRDDDQGPQQGLSINIQHENVLFGHNIMSNGTSTGASSEKYTHYQRTDLRDITSWYHVVMQYTPNSATGHSIAKLYLNGVEQPTLQYNTGAVDRLLDSGSQDILIGRPEDYFQGYLAEYHFVDGTAYQASDFGRFDPDGNWVPKRFEGTYGSTGFYLDFSDPDDLGADRSGNNQHFTPNGFVSASSSFYTHSLEGSHSPPNYSYQPIENRTAKIINAHFAFNGDSSGYVAYPVGIDTGVPTSNTRVSYNGFLYFRYTLTGVTKFRVKTTKPIAEVWFNGTITSFTDTSAYNGLEWVDLSSVLPGTTITEFAIKAGYGYATYIAAIEINDQQLVDPDASVTDWTYDSPTNTHAIWSDLSQNSEYDWTEMAGLDLKYNNNLQTTFGGFTEGKYYMEIVPSYGEGTIGVTDAFQPDQSNLTAEFGKLQNVDSLGFDIDEQKIYRGWPAGIACSAINQGYLLNDGTHSSYWSGQGSSFGSDDILGVAMDFDNGEFEYFYNGTSLGKLHNGYEDDVYGNDDTTYNSSITDKIFTGSGTQGRFGFDGSNNTSTGSGTGAQNANWIYFKPSNPIPIFSSLEIFTHVFGELRVNGTDTGFSSNSATVTGYTISNPPSMLYEIAIKGNSLNKARFSQIKIDGVPLISVPPLTPGKKYYITGYGKNISIGSSVMQTNFGQQPYKYAPPVGFGPVSRKNMRRQKNINGEDYFKIVDIPGSGSLEAAQSTMPDGLWWIKDRENTTDHLLIDSINGKDDALKSPTGTRGHSYSDPSGKTVIWGWKAGGFPLDQRCTTRMTGNVYPGGGSYENLFDGNTDNSGGTFALPDPTLTWSPTNWTGANSVTSFRINATRYANGGSGGTLTVVHSGGTVNITVNTNLRVWHDVYVTGTTNYVTDIQSVTWTKEGSAGSSYNTNSYVLVQGFEINGTVVTNTTCGLAPANDHYIDNVGYASTAAAGLDEGSINPIRASVGTEQGFSIIQWTGTGSNETISHGLNQSPEFIIISGGSPGIPLYHPDRDTAPSSLYLRLNSASTHSGGVFRDAEFTDSVFAVSGDNIVNSSGDLMTAYLWHSVPGYSAIGSFEGTGSRYGPLIELGFRPAFVMFKTTPNNWNWRIHDSEREYTTGTDVISGVFNTQWNYLEANTTAAQSTTYSRSYYYQHASIDFLSNGFKLHTENDSYNYNGLRTYYIAFAERPSFAKNFSSPNAR